MALLPKFITLLRDSTYLQYVTQEGQHHAAVENSSRTIVSEENFTKFEVVYSGVRDMVHLRTCYNNKFLQLNPSNELFYATADEPEEDRAKESCTMFRFVIDNDNVIFYHRFDHDIVFLPSINGYLQRGRFLAGPTKFIFTDMISLAILPKHVMFKGDDGNYLRARKTRLLEFISDDPMDPRAHHISTLVAPFGRGEVRLLSPRFNNLYWQRIDGDWLQCNAGENNHQNSLFRPVRQSSNIESNTIALLNTANNRYCERWTYGKNARRIRASHFRVPYNALLTVEEAIRDREISNIRYHAMDARLYGMQPITTASQVVFNYGHTAASQRVGFSYREVTEDKFSSSHSWKLSVKASLKVQFIPKIVKGSLTVNAAYSGKSEWSTTERFEKDVSGYTNAPVPARSSVRVTLIVGQGFMDVPFSYIQRDLLMDGITEIKNLHDGLLSGFNTYEMQYHIGEAESLPPDANPPPGGDNIVIVPSESRDLPRMPLSRVLEELSLEGKDDGKKEELVPMVMEEGNQRVVPPPSKL